MKTIPVKDAPLGLTGKVKIITYKAGTKEILHETPYQSNLIMLGTNTGKSLILSRLASNNTYSLNINYGALGTSATAPAITDTQLTAEGARQPVSLQTIASNILTLQFFFADATLPNNTYNEFGTFVDGSASANSGQIFNHILFGTPYVKSAGEDTTVQLILTIN